MCAADGITQKMLIFYYSIDHVFIRVLVEDS